MLTQLGYSFKPVPNEYTSVPKGSKKTRVP